MHLHSLLHAPGRPHPCARTAFSKLKPIICDNVSGNKDSPICRQDGREPQTERRRNQAAALPSACCFRARFGHAARCRGDIRTLEGCRATSGHIMRCRATFGRSNASERPNLARERSRCPKTARESRGVRMSPENPAASGRRPANAALLTQCFRYSGECRDERIKRRTPAARARACFHVPNNFLTPECPLRRYTIVT